MSKASGVVPDKLIRSMIGSGMIKSSVKIPGKNIQPASLDLSIGEGEAIRLPAIMSPGGRDILADATKRSQDAGFFRIPISQSGFLLETGIPYLLPLAENISLPDYMCARANNKSSSGRLNLQVRLLTNGAHEFDNVQMGYKGPMYVVVVAKSFPVRVRVGDTLNQIRFYQGRMEECEVSLLELQTTHEDTGLLFDLEGNKIPWDDMKRIKTSIVLSANLCGEVAAFRFRGAATNAVDFRKRGIDPLGFFEPIYASKGKDIVLSKDGFYILSTREAFSVPPGYCSEMVAYNVGIGEYRSHFAGFFDPGWGYTNGLSGGPAVLEVIPHEDIILSHGDPVCAMELYSMIERPTKLYGQSGNNYLNQAGPRLSKHFAMPEICK